MVMLGSSLFIIPRHPPDLEKEKSHSKVVKNCLVGSQRRDWIPGNAQKSVWDFLSPLKSPTTSYFLWQLCQGSLLALLYRLQPAAGTQDWPCPPLLQATDFSPVQTWLRRWPRPSDIPALPYPSGWEAGRGSVQTPASLKLGSASTTCSLTPSPPCKGVPCNWDLSRQWGLLEVTRVAWPIFWGARVPMLSFLPLTGPGGSNQPKPSSVRSGPQRGSWIQALRGSREASPFPKASRKLPTAPWGIRAQPTPAVPLPAQKTLPSFLLSLFAVS